MRWAGWLLLGSLGSFEKMGKRLDVCCVDRGHVMLMLMFNGQIVSRRPVLKCGSVSFFRIHYADYIPRLKIFSSTWVFDVLGNIIGIKRVC